MRQFCLLRAWNLSLALLMLSRASMSQGKHMLCSTSKQLLSVSSPVPGCQNCVCRYSYNIATNADERRDNPTPAQQRINELLQEKRHQKQFEDH